MQQEPSRGTCPVGLLSATFDAEYVAGAVAPFLLSSTYVGETPSLPMIDLTFEKLDLATAAKVPVNPGTVLDDNIAFPERRVARSGARRR